MSHIILTKEQADAIRGRHGIYSAVEPVPTPDGKYIVPEACLSDADLEDIKTTLESYVTPTNVQEITDLPEVGEEVIKDKIYKYSDEDITLYSGLVICMQTHNRTIYPPMETPALFSFFRKNTDDLEWIPNEMVELGWKRWYESKQYECLQAHQTLSTWTPDVTPALWKLVAPATNEWTYPVSYSVNQLVTYQGSTYKCLQAHTSQAGWTPPVVPALWQLV